MQLSALSRSASARPHDNVEPHLHGPQSRVSSMAGDMIVALGNSTGHWFIPSFPMQRLAASAADRQVPPGQMMLPKHIVMLDETSWGLAGPVVGIAVQAGLGP